MTVRQIEGYSLWVGTVVDAWDLRSVLNVGVRAVVDLAGNEAPIQVTRDLVYCRIPLVDGVGNEPGALQFAVEIVATLIRGEVPTLVFCSAGMSRAPAIAAAALSLLSGEPLPSCLQKITVGHPHDVAGGLLCDVQAILARRT